MEGTPLGGEAGGNSVFSYSPLSAGPIGTAIGAMVGPLNAIGYFHRVKIGRNPLLAMPRAALMVRGLRRAKGPTRRKLPTSLEDLKVVKEWPKECWAAHRSINTFYGKPSERGGFLFSEWARD